MKSPTDVRGFAPGRAEGLVAAAFKRNHPSTQVVAPQVSRQSSGSCGNLRDSKSSVSTYNGGTTENYKWSQTISEVTVEVALETPLNLRKDLEVNITSSHISLRVNEACILSGDLCERIHPGDSTWILEDMQRITLNFEKQRETWWKCVLLGDAEIDTTKVESKKRIDEYDPETQGSIRKLLFDENQKRHGLLTSDEMGLNEKLKAAWNAEGSPFAGTEFDPNFIRNRNM